MPFADVARLQDLGVPEAAGGQEHTPCVSSQSWSRTPVTQLHAPAWLFSSTGPCTQELAFTDV